MKKLTIGILLAVSTIALGSGFFGGGGAGGGSWGSITGTLSSQTDLQSALDAKAPLTSPTFATSARFNYSTASKVPYLDANKDLVASSVTPTELGYVSGVTSALQTQLDGKIADPGTPTDNALVRWDGTTGTAVQDSGLFLDDVAASVASLHPVGDTTANSTAANAVKILGGAKSAGTGNGGAVQIGGGTSSGGERGAVQFLGNNSANNRLSVITETDNTGYLGYSYPDGAYKRFGAGYFGSTLKVGATTSTEIGVDIGKGAGGGYIAFTRSTANTGMSIQTEYNKSMQIYPPSAVDANPVFGFGDWGDSTKYGRFMMMKSTEADIVWYTEGAGSIGLATGSRPLHIRQTGYRASTSKTVDITADDQAVTVNDKSYVKFTSDSATSTSRTIVLGDGGMEGQVLTLQWAEDAATGAGEIADGTNTQLAGTWTPDINDTLSLIWDGTDWIETARSNN